MRFIISVVLIFFLFGCCGKTYNSGFRDGAMFMLSLEAKERGLQPTIETPEEDLKAILPIEIIERIDENGWITD